MIGMDSLILSTESLVIPHGAGKGLDMLNVRSSLGQRKRNCKRKGQASGAVPSDSARTCELRSRERR